MKAIVRAALCVSILALAASHARAEGSITPFAGIDFGGDAGVCSTMASCEHRHGSYGVTITSKGVLFGSEFDFGRASGFFGSSPGTSTSLLTATFNVVVGVGVGPIHPYAVAGAGVIRSHVESGGVTTNRNSLGYDVGGGVTIAIAPHLGIRGDLRHFHTVNDIGVPILSASQRLGFTRGTLGLSLRF